MFITFVYNAVNCDLFITTFYNCRILCLFARKRTPSLSVTDHTTICWIRKRFFLCSCSKSVSRNDYKISVTCFISETLSSINEPLTSKWCFTGRVNNSCSQIRYLDALDKAYIFRFAAIAPFPISRQWFVKISSHVVIRVHRLNGYAVGVHAKGRELTNSSKKTKAKRIIAFFRLAKL